MVRAADVESENKHDFCGCVAYVELGGRPQPLPVRTGTPRGIDQAGVTRGAASMREECQGRCHSEAKCACCFEANWPVGEKKIENIKKR